ncbi:MAG: peptide deformylase [Eubacteriales bacterium]|nr:peptide deformylase [Eubacteriales bacterium]
MALRTIREMGDPVLEKKAKTIKEVTPRIRALAQDMLETMYDSGGVGLAAPQVGILKRLVVIDITEERNEPLTMLNPEILEQDGVQTGYEGCLSVPQKVGIVTRPNRVVVRYRDLEMNEWEMEAEEFLARAICHELDHLDGHLYVEKVEGGLRDASELEEEQEKEQDQEEEHSGAE